jgi:hypothetical protein
MILKVLFICICRIEQNLFTFYWSFIDISQGCGTCHSTNTTFVSNTTIHINKLIVVTVIYRLSVLQHYSKIIITRNHYHYYLHLFTYFFMVATKVLIIYFIVYIYMLQHSHYSNYMLHIIHLLDKLHLCIQRIYVLEVGSTPIFR